MNKRVYYCQRCLNHGRLEPRKNHKCECAFAQCTCAKCILVEKRRVLNTQLHELEDTQPVIMGITTLDGEMEQPADAQDSAEGGGRGGEFCKMPWFGVRDMSVLIWVGCEDGELSGGQKSVDWINSQVR